MDRIEQLNVYCHGRKVGRLAIVGSSGIGALTLRAGYILSDNASESEPGRAYCGS